MKTFDDLVFHPHPNFLFGGTAAQLFFPNGYGVSVITGGSSYTTEGTYELAVLKGDDNNAVLDYTTPVTDNVEGHLTPRQVSDKMCQVQELKPCADLHPIS